MPQFHYNLARLRYHAGDFQGARVEVDEIIALLPQDPAPKAWRDTLTARIAARAAAPQRPPAAAPSGKP